MSTLLHCSRDARFRRSFANCRMRSPLIMGPFRTSSLRARKLRMKTAAPVALVLLTFCCRHALAEAGQARVFNVREYGARGDGKSLDTAAIQRTLDACGKAGGGTVLFPPGTY